MNRRTFLKSIATVCGAAVVCPSELLKSEPEWMKYAKTFDKLLKDKPNPLMWMRGKDGSYIEGYGSYRVLDKKCIPFTYKGVPIYHWKKLPT